MLLKVTFIEVWSFNCTQISGLVPNMHPVVDSDTEFLRGLNNELTAERERQNALMNVLAHYDKVEADKDNNNVGDKFDWESSR